MEMTHMTTTDRAAAIRAALKAKHITSRQVSVRADYYSMGSSIRITIKDPNVRASVVRSIAEPHESIDRDQFGEILGGGNRFVSVHYDHATLETMGARYLPQVQAAAAQLSGADDRSLVDVDGTPFRVGRDCYSGLSVWGNGGHIQSCCNAEGAAQTIAVQMLDWVN